MSNLFTITGELLLRGTKEAQNDIKQVASEAESSSGRMMSSFKRIGDSLKNAFRSKEVREVDKSLKSLSDTVDSQKNELNQLKERYQDLYITHGKNSKEAKETANSIRKLADELNKNEKELKEAKTASDRFGQSLDDLEDESSEAESSLSSAFGRIGGAIATVFAVDKIKDFGVSIVNASAEVSAETSAFEQIMGSYSDNAQAKLNEVADNAGMVATRLTPYMTSLTAKFKGLGNDIDESTDLATRGLTLATDASAFWDKSLDDSMSALNSFINGSYEGGEAIGLFANDTQLASYAVKQGIVSQTKDWANLDEATKQATRLEYAENMMKLSGATGQASKESGSYANVQANLAEKWRQFKAEIGEPLLENVVIPAMTKLIEVVGTLSDKWGELQKWVSENKDTIQIAIGAVASLSAGFVAFRAVMVTMGIIQSITKWLNGMTLAQKLLNIAMNMNPIGIVIGVLTALGVALVLAYKKSETFRNFVNKLGTAIKNTFNGVVKFFQGLPATFQKIWNSVKSATEKTWNSIKSGVSKIASSLVSGAKSKFEGFKNGVSNIWNSIKSGTSKIWNSIKSGVSNIASNLVSGVKNKFNSFKSSAVNIWNSVKSGIVNAIKSLPSRMASIGSDIVKGLWNGIGDMTGWIVGKVRGFGDSVLSGIKKFFGIKSPSTVMANEVGKFLPEGIAEGVEKNSKSVTKSMEKVGDKLTHSLDSVPKSLAEGFGEDFIDGLERIKPDIQESFRSLFIDTGEYLRDILKAELEEGFSYDIGTSNWTSLYEDSIASLKKEVGQRKQFKEIYLSTAQKYAPAIQAGGVEGRAAFNTNDDKESFNRFMALAEEQDTAIRELEGEISKLEAYLNTIAGNWESQVLQLCSTTATGQEYTLEKTMATLNSLREDGLANGYEASSSFIAMLDEMIAETERKLDILNKAETSKGGLFGWIDGLKEKTKSWAESTGGYLRDIEDDFSEFSSHIMGVFDGIGELNDVKYEAEIGRLDGELEAKKETSEAELEALKGQYDAGLMSYQTYATKKKAIEDQIKADEKATNDEKNKLAEKQFKAKKANDIANVWIDLASGVMKVWAEYGALPWKAGLLAGLLTTKAGLQTGAIASQQYTPFAEGGIVDEATRGLVGEDGREAIVPLERNTEWVGGLAKAISPAITTSSEVSSKEVASLREELKDIRIMLSEYLSQILNKNADIVLNGQSLAYAIAPSIDTNLGNINKLRARGI